MWRRIFSSASALAIASNTGRLLAGYLMQGDDFEFASEAVQYFTGEMLEALPMDEYPYFVEMLTDHAMQPGYSFGAEFEFGLDLILERS